MCSVEYGDTSIINMLLQQPGIDINVQDAEGETALDIAKMKGRRRIIRLIQSKIEPGYTHYSQMDLFGEETKRESTPTGKINEKFWNVIIQGDINEMDNLLEETNSKGKPLLRINARNKNGDIPLILASDLGNLETVRLLLEYKADLSLKDAHGNNALIRAAQKGHLDVVEELLFRQANINSTGQHKRTALIAAAENGHIRVVKLLIKKGAKVTVKDDYGKMALDIVREKMEKLSNASNEYEYYESIKNILEIQSRNKGSYQPFEIEKKMENFSNNREVHPDKNYETDLKVWEKNNPSMFSKVQELVDYIRLDPFRGIGKMERLTGDLDGLYSRRINKKDRIVYEIDEEKVILKSCKGHYKKEKRNRTRTNSKK